MFSISNTFIFLFFLFNNAICTYRTWKFLEFGHSNATKGYNFTGSYFSHKFNDKNYPGSRKGHCFVSLDNSLLLYGGEGFLSDGKIVGLSDLWEYSIERQKWRWLDRLDDVRFGGYPPLYGREYKNMNHPGSRTMHKCVTFPESGKMFLFGGVSIRNYKNDLWEYDYKKNQWKWNNVSKDGITRKNNVNGKYGSKKYKKNDYYPGARVNSCLIRNEKYLYMFGGFGIGEKKVSGWLADLWRFNTEVGKWKFIQTGNQPLMAINSKVSTSHEKISYVGSRDMHQCWAYNNKMYIFSGRGYAIRDFDLWEMVFSTEKWKFVGIDGDLTISNQMPVWKLKYSKKAYPGVREGHSIVNFQEYSFLYGGKGKDSRKKFGFLNDLWVFNHKNGMWKWIDTKGDKKTQKISNKDSEYSVIQYPSGRSKSVIVNNNGLIYMFGGEDKKGVNGDLWRLDYYCFGLHFEDEKVCGGNGRCSGDDKCECMDNFFGENCTKTSEIKNSEL